MDALMSRPIQMCGPPGVPSEGVWERISPDRPEPQPMSRIMEGEVSDRRERARWVMVDWMERMREEVVYLRDSVSL
jgi:hypothetical protein